MGNTTEIRMFGQQCFAACDGNCAKAWGINTREKVCISSINEDDYYFLPDGKLGVAPADPGTYEGGHAKPETPESFPNKWCIRECERSCIANSPGEIVLPDFSKRVYNIPKD